MVKEDSLHQLILSLSSSEKRLFKLFVSRSGSSKDSNYLELFDILSKLEVYDEVKLKKKIKSASTKKHLAQSKKYLKDLILKSMREIDDNRAEDTVNELMREQVFLSKKNLFKEQWKKLQKAKEIAIKLELFNSHLEILDAEMSYLIGRDFKRSLEFFDEYKQEKEELILKIKLLNNLKISKNKIFQFLRQYNNKINTKNLALAQEEISKYDKEEIDKYNSFYLNIFYYETLSYYYKLNGDLVKSIESSAIIIDNYKKKYWFQDTRISDFIIAGFNYILDLFKNTQFAQMKTELSNISNLKITNENDKREFFQNYVLYSMLYYLNTGNLIEAIKFENEIIKGLKIHKDKLTISSVITLYFNLALTYFLNDNFESTLIWLDKIINENTEVRKDIKSFSEVLKIICYYELEYSLLVPSLIKAKRRQKDATIIEDLILGFIGKINNSAKQERKALFEINQKKLYNNKDFNVGKEVLSFWIRSNVEGKSINDLYLLDLGN